MLEVIPIRLSVANCYLLKTGTGYVLVDTGFSWHRRALHRALEDARCNPGDLKLVVITHGDMDHTGNCVWLRKRYGAPVAMHGAEVRAVERGNMFLSRKSRPNPIVRALAPVAARLFSPRFTPQVLLNDGDNPVCLRPRRQGTSSSRAFTWVHRRLDRRRSVFLRRFAHHKRWQACKGGTRR